MIIRQIGEGGMSRVFEAEDETLGRRVALKILNRQYSRDSIRLEQFRREAHITANVTHPNVIKLYSVGYDQGYFYIAMELVGGGSLEQRIRREGHLKEAEALRIGREVAEGLRAAQQLTLIHRDVKPANILFTETGTAKVVDFGLALFVDRGGDQSGEIWATPYYVAPEKVIENKEDYRSDIFSLGATLYHAMTGNPPHKADSNAIEDLRRIKCKRVALGESGLRFSPRTEHVINGMLSFSPEDRFANYAEVVEEMRLAEGLLDRGSIRRRLFSRRARLIGSIAAAIVFAYAMGWLLREGGERRNARTIQLSTANESDLNGTGVTLQATDKKGRDRKTVSERFTEARHRMLDKFEFDQARFGFTELVDSKDLLQPTENWARFNAALCSIILRRKKEAEEQFAQLATTPDLNGLAPFFTKLKKRMADGFGLGLTTDSLGYDGSNEEMLGYLVHGLAEWHHGDAIRGGEHLQAFWENLEKIRTITAADPASPQGWLLLYKPLIQRYLPDIPLVRAALQQQKYSSVAELRAALADRQQKCREIKTSGPFLDTIKAFETGLQREISRMTLEAQHLQMEEEQKHRKADLELLGEVDSIVPSFVQGYDYSRAIEILTGTHLDTADVRNALDGRVYLYTQSRDFIRQLTTDLTTKGWTGTITRKEGGQLTGRITTNPQGTTITITLDRGTLTLPFESLTPETLVEIAQSLVAQVTDSTEYYRRLESAAAFARLNGLTQLSTTIAAQLREENASFLMRWMKVMAAGI
ncbi:serine/threonine-protein kinase [Prosthecobacter sp.]|uniref:serine/threonine-protein kinase n=1 Tax=Prosthecobacter sp. TaxID=1965333 RepID=UPI00378331BA